MGTVVLVRQGKAFSPEYVTMLRRMVNRRVVTLTDQDDTPGETVPLRHGLQGWWAKCELVSPELEDLRPFLFMDLDTYVFGPLDSFFPEGNDLWLIKDFNGNHPNTGVMYIPKNKKLTDAIWEQALSWGKPKIDHLLFMKQPHRLLNELGEIRSYKKHGKDGPAGTIMCFHGQPKPHNVTGWAKDVWDRWTQ